ncbi:MAG: hypothetical protein IJ034_03070 [Mailhella sp.]|nr:hypothetical protein [Mailhella sp.]MBQ8744487.1 hypothetical protein [Mailhella sp.]
MMKRFPQILLLAVALLLAPCAASAAPAPAPASAPAGPEGAPAVDTSPAPETLSAAEREAALAGAEDVHEMNSATPPKRLTLAERLTLQNAVCVLWHNTRQQNPTPVESLDLMNMDAPDHVFISPSAGYYFENGAWVLEGLIRVMEPDSTGIERIPTVQYFNVHFKPQESGSFFPAVIQFTAVGGF